MRLWGYLSSQWPTSRRSSPGCGSCWCCQPLANPQIQPPMFQSPILQSQGIQSQANCSAQLQDCSSQLIRSDVPLRNCSDCFSNANAIQGEEKSEKIIPSLTDILTFLPKTKQDGSAWDQNKLEVALKLRPEETIQTVNKHHRPGHSCPVVEPQSQENCNAR